MHKILILAFLVISVPLECGEDVRLLRRDDYFSVVNRLIKEAKRSIDIYMYFIIADSEDSENPVNQLLDSIIQARRRGVSISVCLEDSRFNENRVGYERLFQEGIDVGFDLPSALLHAKVIVVDGRYCVIGSTNWSRSAIGSNYEASVLIDSEELARDINEYFRDVKTIVKPVLSKGVKVPYEFLLNPNYRI